MDDIRKKIIDYAIETIRNNGLKALTLQNITKDCHISRSTFYRYFASKDALIEEIRAIDGELDTHSIKEKILLAASEEFSRHPYKDIDIETIAKAVNMQRNSVYRYFPSKEQLFEESLKMELENRRAYYQKQDIFSMDFKSALNVFFDYLTDFRKNEYKSLTFFQALACAQHSPTVHKTLESLWKDTADALAKVLQHGKETGVLRKDFSTEKYSQILLSYIGGSSIFSFENYDLLKETFLDLIFRDLKAPDSDSN